METSKTDNTIPRLVLIVHFTIQYLVDSMECAPIHPIVIFYIISVIRRIWISAMRTTAQGKPAKWSFDKEIQDFKFVMSCQLEKIERGRSTGKMSKISDNLALFSGNQKKGGPKKEVTYRRLQDGGGTSIRKGFRKAVSAIW